MIRLDGNSILLVDGDTGQMSQLSEFLEFHGGCCKVAENIEESINLLEQYDFDLVISNYYLNDGLIFQLMDWIYENKEIIPVFTCVGYPLPSDRGLSRRQSIAGLFTKNNKQGILTGISDLLFDFQKFQDSFQEIITPIEIQFIIQIGNNRFFAQPVELTSDTVFLQVDEEILKGSSGILRFSFNFISGEQNIQKSFMIPGLFREASSEGYIFNIDENYHDNWNQFLELLRMRQLDITSFLKKAAGH